VKHALRVTLAALALPLAAAAALVRTGDAEVQFVATGPAGLRINGKSYDLQVADSGAAVKVTVPLAGLKTGIELRDRHLREKYLHVAQHPHAVLEVPRAAIKHPAAGGSVTAEADGTLTLHGQAKPVRFKYTAQHHGARIRVEGSLRIDIRNHGIEVPSYMGLKVKPEVDAGAKFYVAEAK
jgi:polyisoprenoid-binding protein YceI